MLPEDEWTTRLEEPMIDWARSHVGGDADVFLFGHSAGGQFLSRVAAYERPEDVSRIVVASPSTWVLPSLTEDAPYGFDGLGTNAEERAALKEYLALPMTIYLGSEDDNPDDADLSTGSAAMRQGSNRLDRGINTFEMGQEVAEANGWNFNWSLVIAEGVGHSGSAMLRAPEIAEALQPTASPANAASFGLALTADVDRTMSLTVDASDDHGGGAREDVTVTADEAAHDVTDPIGESGTITFSQANGSQWHIVQFAQALDDPAVVMGGLTANGSQASTLRVRNVTDLGFEFQLDEWDYLDGRHVSETASWIAIEQGAHALSNGMVIEAGSADASGAESGIDLGSGNFSSAPAVLAQVTSTNDANAVTDRVQGVSASGFTVRLDSEESQARGSHGDESVDWIALETGGSANADFVVGRTGDEVTSATHLIDFNGAFASDTFVFVADMQSGDGDDTAELRLSGSNNTSASAYVHEEQSRDGETWHTSEVMAYLGMDPGLIYTELLLS